MAFGLVFGMGRLSHLAPVRWVCGIVVEFFRAVPVLLMMYLHLLRSTPCSGIFSSET